MTPSEPASQPAILIAYGRPRTPVPTTETIMFPSVWPLEAPTAFSSRGTPAAICLPPAIDLSIPLTLRMSENQNFIWETRYASVRYIVSLIRDRPLDQNKRGLLYLSRLEGGRFSGLIPASMLCYLGIKSEASHDYGMEELSDWETNRKLGWYSPSQVLG